MRIALDHTIVPSRDQRAAARDLGELLGLPTSTQGPFDLVELENGVSLDFFDVEEMPALPQHLAFLVSEAAFDEIFGRIRERGLPYWADPARTEPGRLNHRGGGRGVYWDSLDGHNLEILTSAG